MSYTARPTTYMGIRMRSRLEARFAAWLEDGTWQYEPRAFANKAGQYLPDFLLPAGGIGGIEVDTYVEVKPTAALAMAALERMSIIWDSDPNAGLIVVAAEDGLCWVATGANRMWSCERTSFR